MDEFDFEFPYSEPPTMTAEEARIELIASHIEAAIYHLHNLIDLVDSLDELNVSGNRAALRQALSDALAEFDPPKD